MSAGSVKRNRSRSLNLRQQREFTQSLALLLGSGLSLQESLEIQSDMMESRRLQTISRKLLTFINQGLAFSTALSNLNGVFPPSYIGMIQTGEEIGDLAVISNEMSEYISRQADIQSKVRSAMIYPLLVLGMVFTGLGVFTLVFAPRLIEMFAGFNPLAAEDLASSISTIFLTALGGVLFLLLIMLLHSLYLHRRNDLRPSPSLYRWEGLLLKLPVLKTLLVERDLFQLYFSLSVLNANGVSIERAIERSLHGVSLLTLKKQLRSSLSALQRGQNLSAALNQTRSVIPKRTVSWIGIGEKTGDPGAVFSHLYEYQKKFLATYFERLMALVEPGLTILVGLIIISVILQFIVPFFSIFTEVI